MMEEFAREEVERALEAILADVRFAAAKRMSAFLAYVVQQTLDGNGARIKAYTVGIEALEKPETFDPQVDPSVRVLAKRLRSSLLDYHERHPEASPVIEIRCGSYRPVFVAPESAPETRPVASSAPAALYTSASCRAAVPNVHVVATHRPGTLDAQLAAVLRGVLAQTPGVRVVRREADAAASASASSRKDYELSLEVLPLEHEQRVELQLLRASDGQVLEGMTVRVSADERRCPPGTVTRGALVAEIERFAADIARPGRALMSDYTAVAPITSAVAARRIGSPVG